jgi:hypothetical protein
MKKECRELREILVESLEGALDPEVEASVRAHLEECAECSRWLGTYRREEESWKAAGGPEPGDEYWEDLTDRIMARVRAPAIETRRARRWWLPSLGRPMLAWGTAAAVVVLVGIGVIAYRQERLEQVEKLAAGEAREKVSLEEIPATAGEETPREPQSVEAPAVEGRVPAASAEETSERGKRENRSAAGPVPSGSEGPEMQAAPGSAPAGRDEASPPSREVREEAEPEAPEVPSQVWDLRAIEEEESRSERIPRGKYAEVTGGSGLEEAGAAPESAIEREDPKRAEPPPPLAFRKVQGGAREEGGSGEEDRLVPGPMGVGSLAESTTAAGPEDSTSAMERLLARDTLRTEEARRLASLLTARFERGAMEERARAALQLGRLYRDLWNQLREPEYRAAWRDWYEEAARRIDDPALLREIDPGPRLLDPQAPFPPDQNPRE